MENKNDLLTKREFKEIFFGEMGKVEERIVERMTEKIDGSIDRAVGGLAIMVQKGFEGVATDIKALNVRITALETRLSKFEKYVENRFDAIAQELKDIRKQIAQVDTRAEVVDLGLRVDKIEKKLGLKA